MAKVSAEKFFAKIMVALEEKWGYIWGTAGTVWTAEKQAELEKKYNSDPKKYKDLQKAAEIGKKWIGKKVSDCSGLPYWASKAFGLSIYHGSNSIWNKNLSHKGKIKANEKYPKGTAIFTGTDSSKPHIGTYDGEKYVVEAQGTSSGVVRTLLTNSKWKYWGLYKDVEYDFIPGTQKKATPKSNVSPIKQEQDRKELAEKVYPLITKNTMKTGFVLEMQERLLKAGEELPKYGADGNFGSETLAALKSFQKKHGLKPDGKCGPLTWAELFKY